MFRVLFTFPSRYWFTIGLSGVFSLAGWSRRIPTGFLVSRGTQGTTLHTITYVYGAVTHFGQTFQNVPLYMICIIAALQPRACLNIHGLGCSLFDRLYSGNHYCFLFLRVLRCFSSPGLPPDKSGCRCFTPAGCPIRISTDRRLFAPPRSFSQLITSFLASESLGIHHTPLVTFLIAALAALYSVFFSLFIVNMSKNFTRHKPR